MQYVLIKYALSLVFHTQTVSKSVISLAASVAVRHFLNEKIPYGETISQKIHSGWVFNENRPLLISKSKKR